MDKRILKTKKCLKDALLELLKDNAFEKITVTKICEVANTSRITFYTYYSDKYELLSSIFEDMKENNLKEFHELQKKNNPSGDMTLTFQNMLHAFISISASGIDAYHFLFRNTELMLMYYNFLAENVKELELNMPTGFQTKYPLKKLNAFFILGFWGFLHTDATDRNTKENLQLTDALVSDLVHSGIFESPRKNSINKEES